MTAHPWNPNRLAVAVACVALSAPALAQQQPQQRVQPSRVNATRNAPAGVATPQAQPQVQPPTLTQISPNRGAAGDTVTLTGQNFGTSDEVLDHRTVFRQYLLHILNGNDADSLQRNVLGIVLCQFL